MRTKTLLLTAAVAVAGVAGASAQAVYSVNAVGYVNITVPKGFSMVANPLNAATNTVGAIFASAPDQTTVYTFGATGFSSNTKDFGDWGNANEPFVPGGGSFIQAPSAFPVTFVGEVPQGNLTNNIPKGFSIKSSMVPQQGAIDTVLGFPIADQDSIYKYNNTTAKYDSFTYDFGDWGGPAPVINVAEAFWVRKGAAATWVRNFSVNN
ncbi:MAG TPA: hypothetical protein VHH73_15875 [Verrucomicrobiae bacterium]|nr:hypothetical protein [Verrucomicrobiae bacterium]